MLSDIGCVIMASGKSRRFGSDKLLADFLGRPLYSYILDATDIPGLNRVLVTRTKEPFSSFERKQNLTILFHKLPDISDTIRLGLEFILNNRYFNKETYNTKQLSGPVPTAENRNISSVMFCTADQPLIKKESVLALMEESRRNPDKICRLSYKRVPGSPVIFPKVFFEELRNLEPGQSGRDIINRHKDSIVLVEASSEEELMDIDTTEDLEKLSSIKKDTR